MLEKKLSQRERRRHERRAFQSFMQFTNDETGELVGDLSDISLTGFRLEGSRQIPPNSLLRFHVDIPPEIPGKTSIVIPARSRWIRRHPIDPRLYVSGYEVEGVDAVDGQLFQNIFHKYSTSGPVKFAGYDYVWKD